MTVAFTRRAWLELALVAAVCVGPLLLPGDAPWINDEPKLISHALQLNAQHRWAEAGLEGTHGARYGPLPTWLYQAYLHISHDLIGLVICRAALTMLGAAFGL